MIAINGLSQTVGFLELEILIFDIRLFYNEVVFDCSKVQKRLLVDIFILSRVVPGGINLVDLKLVELTASLGLLTAEGKPLDRVEIIAHLSQILNI